MVAERIPITTQELPAPCTLTPTLDEETMYRRLWRSAAAREGWRPRRAGMTPHRRLCELRHRVEDSPARLLCCDLAERIALPVYQRPHPDDPRPQLILWTARRYARGEASERERLGARANAVAMDAALVGPLHLLPPDGKALEAIIWCLNRFATASMLWSVERWLGDLLDDAGYEALLAEMATALAAMPQRPRKEAPPHKQEMLIT